MVPLLNLTLLLFYAMTINGVRGFTAYDCSIPDGSATMFRSRPSDCAVMPDMFNQEENVNIMILEETETHKLQVNL